jgi:succinyl-CoA synthetase beta subunit
MHLYEYEVKSILREYAIRTPRGVILNSSDELAIAHEIPIPWYIKAQVPIGGRGKAGGIIKVTDATEAPKQIKLIIGKMINSYPVEKVLVEEAVDAQTEMYLAITIDRKLASYLIIAGSLGGMEIENITRENPGSILKIPLSPLRTIRDFDIALLSKHLGLDPALLEPVLYSMYNIMTAFDAELIEINPLALTKNGLIALDGKIQIDDFALFRQPAIALLPSRGHSKEEELAASLGLNYVALNGNIGIICNGAGLTMATMDLIKSKGGEPENFLDLGGGAQASSFRKGITFLNANERTHIIFINIFGGITRCDEVAKGIVEVSQEKGIVKPIIIRLIGTNANEGRQILEGMGIRVFSNLDEAAEKAVQLAGGPA